MKNNKIHRGEILREAVKASRVSKTYLAEKMGYNRTAYYDHIKRPDLEMDIIYRYGKAIPYDFSIHFPELASYEINDHLTIDYSALSPAEAIKTMLQWKDKYFLLLEENRDLRVKIETLSDLLLKKK